MTSIAIRADAFAEAAHGSIDHRRKYTNDPYIVHPRAVAARLAALGFCDEVQSAALLHDVVEDTPVTIEMVRSEFGDRIAGWVASLTDVPVGIGFNRAARKRMNNARLMSAEDAVHSIKLADLIDNTSSIVALDPDWAPFYLREKVVLLGVLKRGHPVLVDEAKRITESAFQAIRKAL